MQRAEFEALRAASETVARDTLSAFSVLQAQGFKTVPQRGAYPRVHAERVGEWILCVDFWMCLSADGRYLTTWSSRAPFELAVAASLDRAEDGRVYRYWKKWVLYAGRPYEDALSTLAHDLGDVVAYAAAWTKDDIIQSGERIALPQGS